MNHSHILDASRYRRSSGTRNADTSRTRASVDEPSAFGSVRQFQTLQSRIQGFTGFTINVTMPRKKKQPTEMTTEELVKCPSHYVISWMVSRRRDVRRCYRVSELSKEQREELIRWAQSRTLPAGDVFRARLMLALGDGKSWSEVEGD